MLKKWLNGIKKHWTRVHTHAEETEPASVFTKRLSRRQALRTVATGTTVSAAAWQASCNIDTSDDRWESTVLNWQEYFKGHYRQMSDAEKKETIDRLTRLHEIKTGRTVNMSSTGPRENVLYGYAFNISKCRGYMDCVRACVEENNLDRDTAVQYIRIMELKNGSFSLDDANSQIGGDVPKSGHFYLGTQCFQCENPPCVDVCPVGATWKEEDGIVVIDYDWCIGCRYCEAACPYWARRFNWGEPKVPTAEINPNQHYLGNRARKKGVMEKCTYCIQRTRNGQLPACAEACPTGARVFGNLLDPQSEIRQILATKKVFRLKEDLGTEPKFWYFMD